ncbi:MAG TPA: PAAR domain-containing protein [Pyrinomonadaceae bacterium]|jgi:uncharacterized Zn-binding protein involved in type VI secretion|nr:PAAR domain-containing protein [Pyrinomonadaceae bacterium]
MGQPAAKQGDQIVATDTHIVLVPSASGSVPTPLPHPFSGILDGGLSSDVNIEKRPAATVNSTATNTPPHIPTPPGVSFANPPKNQGKIIMGSSTVMINNKPAARTGDTATTCNDPADLPVGTVVASSTVLIG